jgi:hypothetical protein
MKTQGSGQRWQKSLDGRLHGGCASYTQKNKPVADGGRKMSNLKHARYWKYDGNHHAGRDCERYDPHELGLELLGAMAYISEREYQVCGVALDDVVVRHHKGNDFGHQIHVAATDEQWGAMRQFMAENPEYC